MIQIINVMLKLNNVDLINVLFLTKNMNMKVFHIKIALKFLLGLNLLFNHCAQLKNDIGVDPISFPLLLKNFDDQAYDTNINIYAYLIIMDYFNAHVCQKDEYNYKTGR